MAGHRFFCFVAPLWYNGFMATPHNSKCRYGERGAADAKPKAQIILDAAKVSAASGGNSEPKQGQRSQSARFFCPRSTMRVPQPDIIEHFGNADAVPQLPERCKPQGGNCAVLPRYLLTKQKSAQPRRQAGAARLCAKQNLFCSFCFFVSGIRTGSAFCTADPVVLAPCLDCSDYSTLPKFCKHFLSASG